MREWQKGCSNAAHRRAWKTRDPVLSDEIRESSYTARHGKNKDRAARICGRVVVCGVAFHDRIFAAHFLEGRVRHCDLAVLSRREVQFPAALVPPRIVRT